MTREDLEAFRKTLRAEIGGAGVFKGSFTAEEFHQLARRIMGNATKLTRLAVKACNEPVTPADERAEFVALSALKNVAATYGITFETDGDPRGCVVRLLTPHCHRENSIGGGWCVPTYGD
jgi:fructose-1,6-bisphosphatase/inositol monophosphatase family enzyme